MNTYLLYANRIKKFFFQSSTQYFLHIYSCLLHQCVPAVRISGSLQCAMWITITLIPVQITNWNFKFRHDKMFTPLTCPFPLQFLNVILRTILVRLNCSVCHLMQHNLGSCVSSLVQVNLGFNSGITYSSSIVMI